MGRDTCNWRAALDAARVVESMARVGGPGLVRVFQCSVGVSVESAIFGSSIISWEA